MTTADQLAIAESFLANANLRATFLAEGGIVQGWMKSRRLLVVIQKRPEMLHAVFVFQSSSFPVSSPKDLNLDTIIPVDESFRCEIDAGDAVLVKILSKSNKTFMFEMLPGYHTQNFVAELFRLQEISCKQTNHDFSWAATYCPEPVADNALDALSLLDSKPETNKEEGKTKEDAKFYEVDDLEDSSDSSSFNRQDIAMGITPIAARESVIKYQMALKESQYTNLQPFTFFIGTWNVNGQSPTCSLIPWLVVDEEPPDLYAIGFQELDLSKEAFVFNESLKEDEWLKAVISALHPKAKYKVVRLIRLVGMMLLIFVKEEHFAYIKNVVTETVGTGIMGKLGNKGGVATRFEFHNTSVCLVNSHLAAHVTECERRNQDFHDICNRMYFAQFAPPKAIKDHDMIFWLGDLNYRITDLDANGVKLLLKENRLLDLLKIDQFNQQRERRKAFVGYNEGAITFVPTYKFDPGTDLWDSSEKCRAPAWTDRILWKGDHIKQNEYRSHMELKISDHKPVSAFFTTEMKVVDPVKYRKIYEDVMKKLDRLENEFLPQVTVDTTEINFETIKFYEPVTKTLSVANTGQVPVQFEFIKKLDDKNICKPWLTVEPSSEFVMPGEKKDIELEVFVSKTTAGALTSGKDQLYDILVLHLIGGKDIFITISGSYQKSVFGASINALCKMTVPISELSVAKLMEFESKADLNTDVKADDLYPVPKEIWFLCDLITSLGLDTENLFLQPGLRSEILVIRDWLDTGLPVDKPDVSINSAAETLLLFLESLREPIIPYNLYGRCLDSAGNFLQCKQVISQLPWHHKMVFNYLTAFLREVIKHSAKNGIDPKILATLFAGIFLRDPPGTNFGSGIRARTQQQVVESKKARFIYHFIVNEPDD